MVTASFRLQLGAALEGNLQEQMAQELEHGSRAVSFGTQKTVDGLKAALREQVMAAFGSQRLANAWRGDMFPRLPKTSLGAAGTVWSNAPHIVDAFSRATVITSANGFWLAIPSPDAPKIVNGQRVTPSNFPEDRFGKLHFVYRQGKSSLLVVDEVGRTASGKVSRQRKRKKDGGFRAGTVSVVMFFLVPFVRLSQRLAPDEAYEHALDQLIDNILSEWNRDDGS